MPVRDAKLEDAPTISRFNADMAEETEGRRPDEAVLRRGVERGLVRPELCRYWVAERDGEVVGQVMVTFEWSDWRDGVVWWLQSVYVAPVHRRSGIFRALYEHVEKRARSDGEVVALRLYVEHDNVSAQQTYRALGMQRTDYLVFETDWSAAF